ncbi:MAG: pyridoxamine 5'-phosphate oxidase family protein [Syntrophus sp. (in: bacteria)]|nr:pyridoxamine 5'-phosphate oxidase family protein [Syntrophus sp. (in: bacteria)]
MRREEREIRDQAEILAIMNEALVCRLGLSDDGTPYVVPMNFGLGEGCLYLHCAGEGRKLDIIRKNNKVCFEMDMLREIKQYPTTCGWGARYESVIGFGRAVLVENPDEKKIALDRIMEHYGAHAPFSYTDDILDKTTVIRIDIESVTGKRRD